MSTIFKKHIKIIIVMEIFTIIVISLTVMYMKQNLFGNTKDALKVLESEKLLLVSSQFETGSWIYDKVIVNNGLEKENKISRELSDTLDTNIMLEAETNGSNDYIKWVDFNVAYEALEEAYNFDIQTYNTEFHISWIELLAYIATKNGGTITSKSCKDIEEIAKLLMGGETSFEILTKDMKYYNYYLEAYRAVLGGYVGEYEISATSTDKLEKKYGLKAFSPIAKGFPYNDYDDFGVSRSYGFKREHLGHDLMGQIGTPIIAVESGYVEAIGWNQYGGWRLGIRSFDKKRYYYYAHLRQNLPYAEDLKEGSIVTAGDVIGYMGHTGYSQKENVNNIDSVHLHYGIQLIFNESQKEGNNEIWIDPYQLVRFLSKNRSEAVKVEGTKEWKRTSIMKDPIVEENKKNKE